MNKRISTLLLSVLLTAPVLTAQWWKVTLPEDVWLTQVGITAHGAYLMHDARFLLPQAPMCCEPYQSSTTGSMSVSAFVRQEITKHVRLSIRGSYVPMSGTFTQ
ncbi:MAG: hypothetical protein ACK475_00955 [Bacteroidota bacterium]